MTISMAAAIYNIIEAREIGREIAEAYGTRSAEFGNAIDYAIMAEAAVNEYGSYGRRMAQLYFANVWD